MRWPIFFATCLALLPPRVAWAEQRVALVVGNTAYQHVGRLTNPGNDARLIAKTLAGLGFQIFGGGAQLDLTRNQMNAAMLAFSKRLGPDSIAVFYYSGHGIDYHGENYLVPVDGSVTNPVDIDYNLFDVQLILKTFAATRNGMSIVILDACRTNPFAGGLKDVAGGLAQMRAPQGTLIAYATQPNNVALDGANGNSPFAVALADAMTRPGLDIFNVFNTVAVQVDDATHHDQQPWTSTSPIRGGFFFTPPSAPPPTHQASLQPQLATPPVDPIPHPGYIVGPAANPEGPAHPAFGAEPGSQEDLVANIGDRTFFLPGSSKLTVEAKATLDRQARWLMKYTDVNIMVAGNADEKETRSEEEAIALGIRRADIVRYYLIAKGVAYGRIKTISYGRDKPVALGANEEVYQQNRNAIVGIQ